MKLAGIILAAGQSRRMGTPKALLRLGERTYIETIASRMKEAGVGRVMAVVGADRDRILRENRAPGIEWVVNAEYRRGQLSSLWSGLRALRGEEGVVLTLVDHPLVRTDTYVTLIQKFMDMKQAIVVPVNSGKRGHPILFGPAHVPRFLEAPLAEGARWVLARDPASVREVPVEDPGVCADIDTPEDHVRAVAAGGVA